MKLINEMRLDFPALSQNEALARLVVSAFLLPADPTLEQLADVKTAVSEAVTNAIVHGYSGGRGTVRLHAALYEDMRLVVEIIDRGCGIEDVEQARQPFFTTLEGEERSGMGFTVMESFMDALFVRSQPGKGTTVRMEKLLGAREAPSLARRA